MTGESEPDRQQGGFESLTSQEVRRRASAGLFFIGSSNMLLLVVGFLGNLLLARLLTPEDFGLFALGLVAILLATAFSDGGLVAGLVRRTESPAAWELRTLTGVQLVASTAILVIGAAVALPFGEPGYVVIVMLLCLPIAAIQAPGRIVLTRRLSFSRISIIDIASMLVFYAWAISWAAAGGGVWAMATAVVGRTLTSSGLFMAVSGIGWTRPALAGFKALLPTIRFGIVFQLSWIAHIGVAQIANVAAGFMLGVGSLGIWSLSSRLMQLPLALFQSVWHVSFPAMSHVIMSGRQSAPVVERIARISVVVSVLVLVPFAASAPGLVPAFFGEPWRESGLVVTLSCLGLLLVGPVSAATTGTLYAAGDPRSVLRSILIAGPTAVVTAIALMPTLGVFALGVASIVRGSIEAVILAGAVRRWCGARVLHQVGGPVVIGIVAGAVGVGVDLAMGSTLIAGLVSPVVGFALAAMGLFVIRRSDLVAAVGIVREAVSNARTHRP